MTSNCVACKPHPELTLSIPATTNTKTNNLSTPPENNTAATLEAIIRRVSTLEADLEATKERLEDQKAQHKSQCNLKFCHLRNKTHFLKGKSMSFHKPGPHAEAEAVNLFGLITVPILSPPLTLALPNRLSKHAQPGTLLLCTLPPRTPTTETLLPLNHNSSVSSGGQGKAAQWKTFTLTLQAHSINLPNTHHQKNLSSIRPQESMVVYHDLLLTW